VAAKVKVVTKIYIPGWISQ